jgi:hypothetical protein
VSYNTYKIINQDEFEAAGVPSRKVTAILSGIGSKEILVTKGNVISILFEGIFLSLGINGKNYLEFENHAVFIDANNDIWLGIKNED